MFVDSREDVRKFLASAWRKRCAGGVLEPLEALVADVIAAHPEYHELIEASSTHDLVSATAAADPDVNPFLHLSLHIALHEQLQADRPAGIRTLFVELQHGAAGDTHKVEHQMLEVLAEILWTAQQRGAPPDEAAYLARLRRLC